MHPSDIDTATRTPPHYKIIRHRSSRNHVLTAKKPHHSCPTGDRNEKIHVAIAEKGCEIRRVHRFSSYKVNTFLCNEWLLNHYIIIYEV